jgi:hypothetical protein
LRGTATRIEDRLAPEIISGYEGAAYRGDRANLYANLNTDFANAKALARAAAEGTAPSVAAIQQKQGIEDAMRAQATMAASAAGSPLAQAAAMQSAQGNAGMLAQRGVADASMLRAGEMAAARQQYAGVTDAYGNQLQNMNERALKLAQSQAEIQQRQSQINDQGALGYRGLVQGGDIAQAGIYQNAISQDYQRQGYAADQVGKYIGMGLGAATTGVGAGLMLAAPKTPAPAPAPGGSSDIRGKQDISFANDQQSSAPTLQEMQSRMPGAASIGSLAQQQSGPDMRGVGQSLMNAGVNQASQSMGGAPIDMFNSALAKSAATYNYKNPAQEPRSTPTGGKYAGVMAQDLEAVPGIGKQLVSDGPGGKVLERDAVQSAQLAGMGRQQQELDALNQRISALDASNKAYAAKGKAASVYDAMPQSQDEFMTSLGKLKPEEQALVKSMLARGGK